MLPVAVVDEVFHLDITLHFKHVEQLHLVQCVSGSMSVSQVLLYHLNRYTPDTDGNAYSYSYSA